MGIAFLWFMSCNVATFIVGVGLERPWEREGLMHGSIEGLPDVEAIIVLGGGVGSHEKCHAPELFPGADRVWQGARLYNAMKSRVPGLKVYCTGGGGEYATVPLLIDLGVPREAVWFSEEPRNTEEEAKLLKKIIGGVSEADIPVGDAGGAAAHRPKVLLVTSAWHMTRAKMLFDRAGFDVVPAPTDFEMSCATEKSFGFADFVPSADALVRNSSAIKEWVAYFGYRALRR